VMMTASVDGFTPARPWDAREGARLLGWEEIRVGAGAVEQANAGAAGKARGAFEGVELGGLLRGGGGEFARDALSPSTHERGICAQVDELERRLGRGLAQEEGAFELVVVDQTAEEAAINEDRSRHDPESESSGQDQRAAPHPRDGRDAERGAVVEG